MPGLIIVGNDGARRRAPSTAMRAGIAGMVILYVGVLLAIVVLSVRACRRSAGRAKATNACTVCRAHAACAACRAAPPSYAADVDPHYRITRPATPIVTVKPSWGRRPPSTQYW
jgi:hypothetical protein